MLKNVKLATKVSLSFCAVNSDDTIDEIADNLLPSVENLLVIEANANDLRIAQRTLLNHGLSKDVRLQQYEVIDKSRAAYEAAWKIYESLPQTPEEAMQWK